MPRRRHSRLMPEPPEAFDKMSEVQRLGYLTLVIPTLLLVVEQIRATLRLLGIVTLIVLVTIGALTIQVQSRNRNIHELNTQVQSVQKSADQAKEAAQKASTDLSNAIQQTTNQPVNPALVRAYAEITCIAHQAYPCP